MYYGLLLGGTNVVGKFGSIHVSGHKDKNTEQEGQIVLLGKHSTQPITNPSLF